MLPRALLCAALALSACGASAAVPAVKPELIRTYPHDPAAFTQGLVFHNGVLYESTGLYGQSELRRVDLRTGKVLQRSRLPQNVFAEGLALHDGKLYQLTWQNRTGIVYDPKTFQALRTVQYPEDGWGLTTDGKHLIFSDGSDVLRWRDPQTFKVLREVKVTADGKAVDQLNELEWVRGEVWANVWHDHRIARIDPKTGRVNSWLDLSALVKDANTRDPEAVLNGIAYDERTGRLLVTGKLWPKLYEIRVQD